MESLHANTTTFSSSGTWPRAVMVGVLFIVGYLLLDWVSYIHPMQAFNITPWNPQAALAIVLLMACGQRYLPLVFGAILAADFFVRGAPAPLFVMVMTASVLALGYAAIARALETLRVAPKLDTGREVVRLIGITAIGTLLTSILYVGALFASKSGPRDHHVEAILRFWIGDCVGILVTLPLLLMLLDSERRAQLRQMLARKETLAQGAAIAFVLWVVFGRSPFEEIGLFYVLFLPLIWVAARSGLIGAAFAAVIIQSGVILAVELVGYQTLTIFELQALFIALVGTSFFLGVTVEERQRAAVELHESLKLAAAGEMAAALAHELNQPLMALSNYARASQLLLDSPHGSREKLAETLQKIVGETARAAEVVRRLRDFFRTGAMQLQVVALPTLVNEALDRMHPRAVAKGVSIEFSITPPVPELTVDPLQIEVVLRNLVLNAIDAASASNGKPNVRVHLGQEGVDAVRVVVTDTGQGIAPAQIAQIFEPFTTTKASGMGMGLSISRAIVEAHGGRLWAESGGRGVVCFTLPVRETVHG